MAARSPGSPALVVPSTLQQPASVATTEEGTVAALSVGIATRATASFETALPYGTNLAGTGIGFRVTEIGGIDEVQVVVSQDALSAHAEGRKPVPRIDALLVELTRSADAFGVRHALAFVGRTRQREAVLGGVAMPPEDAGFTFRPRMSAQTRRTGREVIATGDTSTAALAHAPTRLGAHSVPVFHRRLAIAGAARLPEGAARHAMAAHGGQAAVARSRFLAARHLPEGAALHTDAADPRIGAREPVPGRGIAGAAVERIAHVGRAAGLSERHAARDAQPGTGPVVFGGEPCIAGGAYDARLARLRIEDAGVALARKAGHCPVATRLTRFTAGFTAAGGHVAAGA